MSHNEWILGRMVDIRLLEFLRILLSCKIYTFGITLIHPGIAAEYTIGDIITTCPQKTTKITSSLFQILPSINLIIH